MKEHVKWVAVGIPVSGPMPSRSDKILEHFRREKFLPRNRIRSRLVSDEVAEMDLHTIIQIWKKQLTEVLKDYSPEDKPIQCG